jgi:Icc protein
LSGEFELMRRFADILRIIQISDCHVASDPAADYRGQNADRNLASLLPAIRRWQPELVLLSGDVSEDGSAASYGRVSAMLNSTGAPVLALPGNHDVPRIMRRYFPLGPWGAPYTRQTKSWQLILLDSSEEEMISGVLSADHLRRLDQNLRRSSAEHVLLALHHQPVTVHSPWIDRYSLEEPAALFRILDRDERIRCICWGHVHQEFQSEREGVLLLGSPSSVANSLPDKKKFTLDLAGPACRWLELHSNGKVETGCLRAG